MADLETEAPVPGDEVAGDTEPAPARGGRRPRGGRGFWFELPFLVVVALVMAVLLKTFVVQAFYIPSSSMEPTLQVGDRVLVTKTAYLYREPVRGEVVVFSETAAGGTAAEGSAVVSGLRSLAADIGLVQGSERDFIKRIIGLPGDEIAMRDGVIFINEVPLREASEVEGGYLSERDLTDFGPVTVEDDHYFMLGDNRPNSADSRFGLGQIHRDQITGRAFVSIWPPAQIGSLPIADY